MAAPQAVRNGYASVRKFRFRLSRVLDYRARTEQECQRHLADCQSRLMAEQKAMAEVADTQHQTRVSLQEEQTGRVSTERLLLYGAYLQALDRRHEAHRERTVSLSGEREQKREALLEASREKRVLEKLRERKWETHRRELNAFEQRQADEVETSRSARRGGQPLGASPTTEELAR